VDLAGSEKVSKSGAEGMFFNLRGNVGGSQKDQ
jgi:hypothetical protein